MKQIERVGDRAAGGALKAEVPDALHVARVRADLVVSERGSVLALHALYAEWLTGHVDRAEIVPAIWLADHGASCAPHARL